MFFLGFAIFKIFKIRKGGCVCVCLGGGGGNGTQ